jgi:hypothetical protein
VLSANLLIAYTRNGFFGLDVRIYRDAAYAWRDGGDPWDVIVHGYYFAAPPPTLVPAAMATLVPEIVAIWLFALVSIGAAYVLVRRLDLPVWWLMFPPVVEGIYVGNPDVIVACLLVHARPLTDTIAGLLKIYAGVPMLLLGRWKSQIALLVALAATSPLLPWDDYIAQAGFVAGTLTSQSGGGRSALFLPILIPVTLAALVVLGRERAAWLAVPVLWPATQLHYSVLAMPALTPLMAVFFALPLPGATSLGVIAGALIVAYQRRGRRAAER